MLANLLYIVDFKRFYLSFGIRVKNRMVTQLQCITMR